MKIIVQWSLAFVPTTTWHQWWYSVHTLSRVNKGDFLNKLLHVLPNTVFIIICNRGIELVAHCETRNCCNWDKPCPITSNFTSMMTVLVGQHPSNTFSLQAQCPLWQGIVTDLLISTLRMAKLGRAPGAGVLGSLLGYTACSFNHHLWLNISSNITKKPQNNRQILPKQLEIKNAEFDAISHMGIQICYVNICACIQGAYR